MVWKIDESPAAVSVYIEEKEKRGTWTEPLYSDYHNLAIWSRVCHTEHLLSVRRSVERTRRYWLALQRLAKVSGGYQFGCDAGRV